MKKQDLPICSLQKTLHKHQDEEKLKEGWGDTYNTQAKRKPASVTLNITGKGTSRDRVLQEIEQDISFQ